MRETSVALLKEAWEALDDAKHELMEGEVRVALGNAVRAAREALALLLRTEPVNELSSASLTTLYSAARTPNGSGGAWESLVLKCVKLLDEAEARETITPEDVEDAIACAEEVINWAETLLHRIHLP